MIEEKPPRPETGTMQFGEDWRGVFIRGDDAIRFASGLQECQRVLGPRRGDPAAQTVMELIALFNRVQQFSTDRHVQYMKAYRAARITQE